MPNLYFFAASDPGDSPDQNAHPALGRTLSRLSTGKPLLHKRQGPFCLVDTNALAI